MDKVTIINEQELNNIINEEISNVLEGKGGRLFGAATGALTGGIEGLGRTARHGARAITDILKGGARAIGSKNAGDLGRTLRDTASSTATDALAGILSPFATAYRKSKRKGAEYSRRQDKTKAKTEREKAADSGKDTEKSERRWFEKKEKEEKAAASKKGKKASKPMDYPLRPYNDGKLRGGKTTNESIRSIVRNSIKNAINEGAITFVKTSETPLPNGFSKTIEKKTIGRGDFNDTFDDVLDTFDGFQMPSFDFSNEPDFDDDERGDEEKRLDMIRNQNI